MPHTRKYQTYVVVVLTSAISLCYLDRGLMILLLEPIKHDLRLTDTQLGFLTGIAFALFYAILGVPIARWADRGNRVTIASLTIGLWGVTVMGCMFVGNFLQLLLARIAAAVGEAGCMPPTYSLVGDYFPRPAERTRAMAVYTLATPLSLIASFIGGGWLNEHYGWRLTFFLVGVPALLVALLVKLTIKEPRCAVENFNPVERPIPKVGDVFKILWLQHSSRHLILAIIAFWTMGFGLAPWYGTFMIRTHAMGTGELGIWFGLIFGFGGIGGTMLGGYVATRWFDGNECGQMRLSAAMITLLVPFYLVFLLIPQRYAALGALIPVLVASHFFIGPAFALMQRLVIDEMRATALAVVMLLANLIGMGLGPGIVGILSDRLSPVVGENSLRCAMLIVSIMAWWAAYHFWQVGQKVHEDLESVCRAKSLEGR